MSKGSRQRTANHKQFLENWDLIFKKKTENTFPNNKENSKNEQNTPRSSQPT